MKPRDSAVLALLLIPMLSGCVSAATTYTQTGQAGYKILCPGSILNCYAKVGNLCKEQGYDVFEQPGDSTSLIVACKSAAMN
jgi:hypothetical protein